MDCSNKIKNTTVITGLFFILIGTLLLLDRMQLIPGNISHIIISWPMLLIAAGVYTMSKSVNTTGILLVLIGVIFILPRTGLLPEYYSLRQLWPVILIFIGLVLLFKFSRQGKETHWKASFHKQEITGEDYLSESAVFGGSEKTFISKDFKGGRINCLFGGVEANLSNSEIVQSPVFIDMSVTFGGVELIVPSNWKVRSEITPIFGGFSDKRLTHPSMVQHDKEVIIRGSLLFGGCEVKSYS